jgi:DNA-binding NarL/FixJ family response regulator
MTKKIRILLVEDHQVMREALHSLLDANGEFVVVSEASNGREALALARKAAPDVVVMDINLPELNGIDATRQIMAYLPQVKIIGLSVHMKGLMVSEMLKAGAAGYVPKTSAAQELLTAIRTVMTGKIYVSPEVLGDVMEARTRAASGEESAFAKLTEREREVLQLLAEGHSTKEIADTLHLSAPTIHTHRQHIMQKLDARSIADLVRYAIREGIVSAGS